MNQIPVKIVEYTISGETRKNVMIDLIDTYEIINNNFKEWNKVNKGTRKYGYPFIIANILSINWIRKRIHP